MPRKPTPLMVRCVVESKDKTACEALVFVREREKHLEEMHQIIETGEKGLSQWFTELPPEDDGQDGKKKRHR